MGSYPFKRPTLTIESTGGVGMGNCYSANFHRVTSMPHRLKPEQLHALNKAGLLGFGQEFYIQSKCDGTEEPAGEDIIECVEKDGTPSVNPYTKEPYKPSSYPFFVYECEARVDSGD